MCIDFFLFKLETSDLFLCDRDHYRQRQLVHRSGQVGRPSPVVVSATMSIPLQLLMLQSLELPYRVGGIASSPLFASVILGFLPPSTPVQRATRTPGLYCERAAPMVSYHSSPFSFGGARLWRSNLNGRPTALLTGSIWFWMWRSAWIQWRIQMGQLIWSGRQPQRAKKKRRSGKFSCTSNSAYPLLTFII